MFCFSDVDDGFKNTKMIFEELGLKHASEEDCTIVQHVCGLVSTRAAYLVSAGQFIDGLSQSKLETDVTRIISFHYPNRTTGCQFNLNRYVVAPPHRSVVGVQRSTEV